MILHSLRCLVLQALVVLLVLDISCSFPHLSSHEHKVLKSVKRNNVNQRSVIVTSGNSSSSSHSIRKRNAATHYFGPDPLNRNALWWKDWWNQYVHSPGGSSAPLVSSPTSLSPSLLSRPSTSYVVFDDSLAESADESEVRLEPKFQTRSQLLHAGNFLRDFCAHLLFRVWC